MTGSMGRPSRWLVGGVVAGLAAGAGSFVLTQGDATAISTSTADEAPTVPRLVEETRTSGIRHVYGGDFQFFVGGGVAVLDCDDDQKPDLFVAGGENPAGLFRNTSEVGGELTFVRQGSASSELRGVVGAYPLDVDSDGRVDLAVLRMGENVLLRGLGQCEFERANESWGLDGGDAWTAAFSATWEGESALPTLAFGNYLARVADEQNRRDCVPSKLVRPADGGYGEPLPLTPAYCTLSLLFSDWNAARRADLRMTNDRHYYQDGSDQLWSIEERQPPRLYSASDGWEPLVIWGMGIAQRDVTGDGLPEVALSSQGDNKLQTLTDGPTQPTYGDIAIRAGTTAHRPFMGDDTFPSTAWHPEFDDVNNDGHVDLFFSKGNVDQQPDHAQEDPSNLLLGRPDGTFVESAREAGVVSMGLGRGAALTDLNLDGMLDLVEVNRRDNVRVWRNVGAGTADEPRPPGSWLGVAVSQPAPNVDAIGAWVEIRTPDGIQRQQRLVGGGHAGGELGWMHWGLGSADRADVRVTWPDGEQTDWQAVDADTFVVVDRAGGRAQVVEPGS